MIRRSHQRSRDIAKRQEKLKEEEKKKKLLEKDDGMQLMEEYCKEEPKDTKEDFTAGPS